MAFALFVLAWTASCRPAHHATAPERASYRDPSPHAVRFVRVSAETRLEVLDWGGSGPPVVLLAGLGNTAHVFDGFAEGLREAHHVYGVTRRGFGASSQPREGYDVPTLGRDLVGVLDALAIPQATFIGHSFAGEELNWLGAHLGGRVTALVYLDAAYDRTAIDDAGAPPEPEPSERDKASVASFAAWVTRTSGSTWPEAEIRAAFAFDVGGRLVGPRVADDIVSSLLAACTSPEYANIHAPVLAVYRVDDGPEQLFPHWSTLGADEREAARTFFERVSPELAAARARFRREIPRGKVVELHGADHYVFLSSRERVLAEILAFSREIR